MLATHVFGVVLRAVDLFSPQLAGETHHTHNVACGSFGDLLHVTSCLHHLVHTLPQSSLFALINMLKCRRIVKREKRCSSDMLPPD